MHIQLKISELIDQNLSFYQSQFTSEEDIQRQAKVDFELFHEYFTGYNRIRTPRVGDLIKTSDGQYFRIATINKPFNTFQTGDLEKSYLIQPFYISYSGGFDYGVSYDFINPIALSETYDASVYISSDDRPGPGRSVTLKLPFRVFEPSIDDHVITKTLKMITNDSLPQHHPLNTLEPESKEYKITLMDYFFIQQCLTTKCHNHPLFSHLKSKP